jgi:DNA-binding transcriptional regulator YiaG
MSGLYLIAQGGFAWLGNDGKPAEALGKLIAEGMRPELAGEWPIESAPARELCYRLARAALERRAPSGEAAGWHKLDAKLAALVVHDITEQYRQAGDLGRGPAEAMRRLRTEVFETTQNMMAHLAGVSTSQVSRWESGSQEPSWTELARLRQFALNTGMIWDDEFLFLPAAPQAGSEAPAAVVIPFGAKRKTDGRPNRGPSRAAPAGRKGKAAGGGKDGRSKAKRGGKRNGRNAG